MASSATQLGGITYVAITIPDNSGTGATLDSLIRAAVTLLPVGRNAPTRIHAVRIDANIGGTAGTARAAFLAATPRPGATIVAADFTTHGRYIAAGVEFYEPCAVTDASQVYVRSASASTVSALCAVYYDGAVVYNIGGPGA